MFESNWANFPWACVVAIALIICITIVVLRLLGPL
jgi:hypothetical protein